MRRNTFWNRSAHFAARHDSLLLQVNIQSVDSHFWQNFVNYAVGVLNNLAVRVDRASGAKAKLVRTTMAILLIEIGTGLQ